MKQPSDDKPGFHGEYDNLAFHPWNIMLFFVLAAVTVLFLALAAAFIYHRVEAGMGALRVPWLFGFNTLLLLASSGMMWRAKKSYAADDTAAYQQALRLTIVLTLAFLALQVLAWSQLFSQNLTLRTGNASAYLYLLSGLHFAHVLAGLPFLFLFLKSASRKMREPVTVLVYFSDPEKRLKLRLLSIYWHFLDALWIFLVAFFLLNYWMK